MKDIAGRLAVSLPSVNNAVKNLKKIGLVAQERYGDIELTADGRKRAEKILGAHTTLSAFFRDILNIDETSAEEDACAVEHYIGQKTLKRLLQFIRFFESCPAHDLDEWKRDFEKHCASGERPEKCRKCMEKRA